MAIWFYFKASESATRWICHRRPSPHPLRSNPPARKLNQYPLGPLHRLLPAKGGEVGAIRRVPSLARGILALAGAVILGSVLIAQGVATGTIEGRVFDAGRGEYLEKARLTIEGTALQTLTDATGQYRFPAVPTGTVRVRVFFTGRGSRTEAVTVSAGQVVQFDITMRGTGDGRPQVSAEAIKLDQFVVSTSKEMDGAAIAINEQRFASSIVNVVSAEEFGTIADGSVGEFMKFLPGITSDYIGGDARRFSINGVPAGNVPISVGGFDMASAAGAGTGRQVELDQVSINSIARIEVMLSPTPETPGMALAGSVNLVPRSAFERSKPAFTYSIAYLMKDAERAFLRKTPGPRWEPTYKIHPGVDFSAVVPINKNFGFTVTAGYSLQYSPVDQAGMTWRGVGVPTTVPATATNGLPDTTPDNPYLSAFKLNDGGKNTERYSFSTTLDYRLGRRDRLAFSFQYAFLEEAFANRTMTFTINRVLPGNWARDHTWGQFGANQIDIVNNARLRPGRTIMPTLTWRHDGPVWKAETGVGYSTSRIQYSDVDKGSVNGATARRTGLTVLFDDICYFRPGKITVLDAVGNPVDPYNLNTYSLVNGVSSRQLTYDTKRQAYFNLGRDLDVRGVPLSLKGGLDMRTAVRDLRGSGVEIYNFVGADGRASTIPAGSDDSAGVVLDESFSTRVPNFGFPPIQWVDGQKLWELYRTHPSYFTSNPNDYYRNSANASKRAKEIVSAAYLRGDAAFLDRRLKLVGGLRAEQTNIKAEGPLSDPTGNYQRDASGNFIRGANGRPLPIVPTTDALGVSRLTLLDRGMHANKEYLRLFPNLNASYSLRDNLIVRASYYQSVGRPDFNQYAGGVTLPDIDLPPSTGNRITLNNVAIKAWQAETERVRLEYYFEQVGQVSIGAFRRDFRNFFGSVVSRVTPEFLAAYDLDDQAYGLYDVATQFNVPGTVRMTGLEFDYKQALTFLPYWARGVQVFCNASSQRATGTDSLQDMTPLNVNWGVSLTRPKYNLRVNWNYRGNQRRGPVAAGNSIEPGTYNYNAKRLYIDVSGEYFLRRELGLFFALRNVGDATQDNKIYGPSTPTWARFSLRQDFAALWTAGIKGSF